MTGHDDINHQLHNVQLDLADKKPNYWTAWNSDIFLLKALSASHITHRQFVWSNFWEIISGMCCASLFSEACKPGEFCNISTF